MKKDFYKYEDAQTICEQLYGDVRASFRAGMSVRIQGGTYSDLRQYSNASEMFGGFNKAEELIQEGRVFFVHPFKCDRSNCPTRFQYGGFWACNTCNTHVSTPYWWKIKVMKDGNAWCCVGDGFINLQESDNYAFGDTKEEAINNYRDVLLETILATPINRKQAR